MNDPSYRSVLQAGSRLHEYRVEAVLGIGGFGVTYRAWDSNLQKHVALKEYFPADLAVRADGNADVAATGGERFQLGLRKFIGEARTLARFSHPNIVRVLRYFEANGTAYVVMDCEKGEPLNKVLRRCRRLDTAELERLLRPLLEGLSAVHAAGFLHRDIKPHNVLLRENGDPVLLDFGAAREALGGRALTSILTPGFAPLEQYSAGGEQGPWSDIYGLAAVLFCAMTAENPPDALARLQRDPVPAALDRVTKRYPPALIEAVRWGLALDQKARPRSIGQWRSAFTGVKPAAPRRTRSGLLKGAFAGMLGAGSVFAGALLLPLQEPSPPTAPAAVSRVVMPPVVLAPSAPAAVVPEPVAPEPAAPVSVAVHARPAIVSAPVRVDRPGKDGHGREVFRRTDRDADGYLTRAELAEAPWWLSNFSRIDLDGDQRLSFQETARFWRDIRSLAAR
jgi:serine/threonine protein kinase